jgi:hypothetical protein
MCVGAFVVHFIVICGGAGEVGEAFAVAWLWMGGVVQIAFAFDGFGWGGYGGRRQRRISVSFSFVV